MTKTAINPVDNHDCNTTQIIVWHKGLCKVKKTSEITLEVGGWIRLSLNFFGKLSQNSPILVMMFWGSVQFAFCLYVIKSCYSS